MKSSKSVIEILTVCGSLISFIDPYCITYDSTGLHLQGKMSAEKLDQLRFAYDLKIGKKGYISFRTEIADTEVYVTLT